MKYCLTNPETRPLNIQGELQANTQPEQDTFDYELWDGLVQRPSASDERRVENIARYERIRALLPDGLLKMTPDFVIRGGTHLGTVSVDDGYRVRTSGGSSFTLLDQEGADEYDHPFNHAFVKRGGGHSFFTHDRGSLGILAIGGGNLDISIEQPTLVRIIKSGAGDITYGHRLKRLSGDPSVTDFVLNTSPHNGVQQAVIATHVGGGEVRIHHPTQYEYAELSVGEYQRLLDNPKLPH